MEVDPITFTILGGVGGLVPDLLRIVGARHEGAAPGYFSSWFFWVSLIALIALGAGTAYMAVVYFSAPKSVVTALGIGYGTPSVISKLLGNVSIDAESAAPASRSTVGGERQTRSLRGWWAR